MHTSGITVDDALSAEFNGLEADTGVNWVKFQIETEQFKVVGKGGGAWEEVAAAVEEKVPSFFAMRREAKWLLVMWIPDRAMVRQRMLYSSSSSALKSGVGGNRWLSENFHCTEVHELTDENFTKRHLTDVRNVVMSYDEREKEQTEMISSLMMGTEQHAIIPGVPITMTPGLVTDLKTVAASGGCVEMSFTIESKSEVLGSAGVSQKDLAGIAGSVPDDQPRYYFMLYAHQDREGAAQTKPLFIYYCPGKAPPKLRMLYSTCKAHVLSVLGKDAAESGIGVEGLHKVEGSEPSDLTTDRLLNDIYPVTTNVKAFAKPKAKSRGKQKLAAFSAD